MVAPLPALSRSRARTSGKGIPAAAAAFGSSEFGVMPGIVLISRKTGVPSSRRMKSLRDIARRPWRR
jgi:hypothetical protein